MGQLRQKLNNAVDEQGKALGKLEEHARIVNSCKSRTDSFDDMLQELSRKWDDVNSTFQTNLESLQQVELLSQKVNDRQQLVEDSVAQKYALLWEDVLKAIEEVKHSQTQTLQEDIDRRAMDYKREGRGHVKYVTQLVATVHDERKRLAMTKDLVTVWKEQTWASARRRTGLHWLCNTLQALAQRRERKVWTRWVRSTSLEELSHRLQAEY